MIETLFLNNIDKMTDTDIYMEIYIKKYEWGKRFDHSWACG